MVLCNAGSLAKHAKENGYGLPALNANGGTYDIARAIIEAAEEMDSPLVIQAYEPNIEYRGFDYFPRLVGDLIRGPSIPVAIHLDHGKSKTSILRAVRAGFTGVMIDYAHLPIDQNASQTQEIVDLVEPLGICVEAEIGDIIKSSDEEGLTAPRTSVEDVVTFAERARVDLLAVAVGTTHGIFKTQTGIDFKLISDISAAVDAPLVLHGTCGVSLDDIAKCVECGMTKINFGEAFRMNYISYFNEYSTSLNHEHHAWRIMQRCKDRLKDDIKEIIDALGSAGKAKSASKSFANE